MSKEYNTSHQSSDGSAIIIQDSNQESDLLESTAIVSPMDSGKQQQQQHNQRRIFVGNLPKGCTETKLQENLSKWGTVENLEMIKSKFAFVTFQDGNAAQNALEGEKGYTVRLANDRPINKAKQINRTSHAQLQEQILKDLVQRLENTKSPHIAVVQCNTSHLSRLATYVTEQHLFQIIGSLKGARRTGLSLLFLDSLANDLPSQTAALAHDEHLKPALNQVLIVSPKPHKWKEPEPFNGFMEAFGELLTTNVNGAVSLRILVYPPRLRGPLGDALVEKKNAHLSPTDFTHVLSFLQIVDKGPCLMGLVPSSCFFGHLNTKQLQEETSDIPRAYYKLQEAFQRYESSSDVLLKSLQGTVAMDCGAAPGGWTRFLTQQGQCRQVYSIDPGKLSPSVSGMEGVVHLEMKLSDALLTLKKRKDLPLVDVFVSDMCLHDMGSQLDMLLEAKPLLKPNSLFVVTLKCVAGHAQSSYEHQVKDVVEKLKAKNVAHGIKVLHLFANRSAERTVMGYLN